MNFGELEAQYSLPSGILNAIRTVESGGGKNLISNSGALGEFQFMPSTAKSYGINPLDPVESAQGAARMLADLGKQYRGNWDAAIAHYNGGTKAGRAVAAGAAAPSPETQAYVPKVKGAMGKTSMSVDDAASLLGLENKPVGELNVNEAAKLLGLDATPASVKAGGALNDIPRQLGLTARYAIEGPAEGLQVLSEPIRYITDRLTGSTGKTVPLSTLAANFADRIGLPKPQGANERVIGDATRMGFGAASGSGVLRGVGTASEKVASMLPAKSSNMLVSAARDRLSAAAPALTQASAVTPATITSAVGAGAAGGASRESGGDPLQQTTSAALGTVLGGLTPSAINSAYTPIKRLLNSGMSNNAMDLQINAVFNRAGVDYSQIPERIKQSLRGDLADALKAKQELDPVAVNRLLDFRQAGLTPTRGMVTQDPVQITKEMNLAKMAANTSDGELHGLPRIQNQNNARLIGNLNELGANRGDRLRAGEALTSSVLGQQAALRNAEQAAWDAAKNSPGYRMPVSSGVLSEINGALDEQGLMPFMNPTIGRYMGAFQTGQQPFTPQAYRNLQSMLSREVAKGGNEGAAASLAQRVLARSDIAPAGFADAQNVLVTPRVAAGMRAIDGAVDDSISAVNNARHATRQAYAYEESSPLVRSVLSQGSTSDPQRIAQRFILNGTANEAEDVARQVGPQGLPAIKEALLAHLKEKALNGAADETGKFSQSAFNKALNAIGERKLSILFTPEEVRALRVNGRVAALMQSQPIGSAVNNSNSGALLLGRGYDALRGIASKVPGGQAFLLDPLKNIEIAVMQRQAQNLLPGLLQPQAKPPFAQTMILPGMAAGGLLSTQMVNQP